MYRFVHILRQFVILLWESKKAMFISIIFLLIGLTTFGSSYIIGNKLFKTSLTLKKNISITVFFKRDSENDIKDCIDEIKQIDGVKSVQYITKEQAKENFEKLFPQYSDVIAALPENPLPPTAKIQIDDLSMGERIKDIISTFPAVDTIIFSKDTAEKINKLINLIWFLFIAILSVVILEFIFTIQSVTSFIVDIRKKDIKVMKLIGADRIFIEAPFIIFSLFSSFVAWILSIFVLNRINIWSSGIVQGLLPFSKEVSGISIAGLYWTLLLFAVIMTLIGSIIPLRRVK